MWEDKVKKRLYRNIVLALMCVAAVASLFFVIKKVMREKNEKETSLQQVSIQKREEQKEDAAKAYLSLEKEYQKDLEAISTYIPGIVCWGDTLTRGTAGNVSYPDVIQSCIDESICSKYDFSAYLSSSVVYSGVDFRKFKVEIPVVNMGGGSENTPTVLVRAGVGSISLLRTVVVPPEPTPVKVNLVSQEGVLINPLTIGNQDLNPVVLGGITGRLDYVSGRGISYYTFTRQEAGEKVVLVHGTEMFCSNTDMYRDYIHVIWLGAYDYGYHTDNYVDWCEALLSRQEKNSDRFIVIGPCSYNLSWSGLTATNRLDEVDARLTALFGDRYISLRAYLVSDGLADADISETRADSSSIKHNEVPNSLRSGNGTVEFSSKAYELIGHLVFERMMRLGYFDEVMDELNLS